MDIFFVLIMAFILGWWIVQIAGSLIGGRKIDDPFAVSTSDVSDEM